MATAIPNVVASTVFGREATSKYFMSSIIVTSGCHAGRTAPNKGGTFPPVVLTEDEVKALIRACSNRAAIGIRNRALITVMYRAGLRLSETLDLKLKDVDADTGTIAVMHGKGDKRRIVGLDPGSMTILLRWADKRHQYRLETKAGIEK